MGSVGPVAADLNEAISPRQRASSTMAVDTIDSSPVATRSLNNTLNSINLRVDPEAQATVTDFLDFTEYLPADMTRSLTLIGKLDQTYIDASTNVHQLTREWGQLPLLPPEERPSPVRVRADISENLKNTVSARIYSHAEASRMADNVNQHYNRAKSILTKLRAMLENWPPPEEQKSPVATTRSPQMSRAPRPTLRGADGHRVRRQQVPRITVPGEVLAPYELNYEAYSDSSESDPEEEVEQGSPGPSGVTLGPQPRIKVLRKEKPPKTPKVPKSPKPKPTVAPPSAVATGATPAGPVPPVVAPPLSTSLALAKLQPPPENAVKGSADAPWLQLTSYELAKLRKRMKKNAAWSPSDTMIARELKNLGRGLEEYKAAKQKAEEEGVPFEDQVPSLVIDSETGAEVMPPGALSQAALAAEEKNLNNPRKRPSVARKPKGLQPTMSAAEEAEESARKMMAIARVMMLTPSQPPSLPDQSSQAKAEPKKSRQKKRKRDSVPEAEAEKPDSLEVPGQRPFKRTKTETPVPPPQRVSSTASQSAQETPIHPPHLAPSGTVTVPRTTPVPVHVSGQDQSARAPSPASSINTAVSNVATTSSAPFRPQNETPIPPPVPSEMKPSTPILPPVRETRKSQAARKQEEQQQQAATPAAAPFVKPPSRGVSPVPAVASVAEPEAPAPTPAAPGPVTRRPTSRSMERRPGSGGKAASQELEQPSLATDRARRASTARNTPAPEKEPARPASRRSKRPAPGVISRTNSGGNSAVGKRKAAPKKKSAAARGKKDKAGQLANADAATANTDGEVEIDDEGNVVDPNETRYCLCNGVSFGTMIACENADVS